MYGYKNQGKLLLTYTEMISTKGHTESLILTRNTIGILGGGGYIHTTKTESERVCDGSSQHFQIVQKCPRYKYWMPHSKSNDGTSH